MKTKMYQEALARLEILIRQGLSAKALNDFKDGKVPMSKEAKVLGQRITVLRTVDAKPQIEKVINKCASQNSKLPYFCIHTETAFGDLVAVFFVSRYTEEWSMDRDYLSSHEACVYVYNMAEDFDEVGFIQYGIKDQCLVHVG